jgi:hypothetical protein
MSQVTPFIVALIRNLGDKIDVETRRKTQDPIALRADRVLT